MCNRSHWASRFLCGISILLLLSPAVSADSNESKKLLKEIRQELSDASKLTKKKQYEESEALLKQTEEKILKWQIDQGLTESNRVVKGLKKVLTKRRDFLAKKRETASGSDNNDPDQIVFSKQILPILETSCFDCHSEGGKGGLRLDTVEGFREGGKSGKVVKAKNSRGSLLMQRMMTTNASRRMPKGEQPLSRAQLQLIDKWIMQGAILDIKSGPFNVEPEKPVSVTIHKPTGKETVSFVKDVAPFMVRLCGNCHNDQQKRGGLSISTFRNLMRGGESGPVLIPGNLNDSRLFRLTGGLELPRMPNNDSRLTRKNYEDLKTWIKEGIKFDGDNPDATLKSMVPTEAELYQQRLAAMSDEELKELKQENSLTLWKRAISAKGLNTVETENFMLFSNLETDRLQQAGVLAEEQLKFVKKEFQDPSKTTWRGKLSIFITSSAIGYNEFATLLEERTADEYSPGIVKIDPGDTRSLIVVANSDDYQTATNPGLGYQIKQLVSIAYLQKEGNEIPQWFSRGMGQHLALKSKQLNWKDSSWVLKQQKDLKLQIGKLHQKARTQGGILQVEFLSTRQIDMIGVAAINNLGQKKSWTHILDFAKKLQAGASAQEELKKMFKTDLSRLGSEIPLSMRNLQI